MVPPMKQVVILKLKNLKSLPACKTFCGFTMLDVDMVVSTVEYSVSSKVRILNYATLQIN
jgi:hypothetical protein